MRPLWPFKYIGTRSNALRTVDLLLETPLGELCEALRALRESSPLPPEVVIQSASSGRYVTVAPDGWLAATTFSPTEPTSRFVVRSVGPALLAALTEARSFSPTSRANAEDELWSGGGAGDASTEASPRSAAPCRWVLLQSLAAGGFVSVRGQHESDECATASRRPQAGRRPASAEPPLGPPRVGTWCSWRGRGRSPTAPSSRPPASPTSSSAESAQAGPPARAEPFPLGPPPPVPPSSQAPLPS